MNFCNRHQISPPVPASELTLQYLVAELNKHHSHKPSKSTNQQLEYHVWRTTESTYQQLEYYIWRTTETLRKSAKDTPLFKYICNGVRRTQASTPYQRETVTIPILHKLKAHYSYHPCYRDINLPSSSK